MKLKQEHALRLFTVNLLLFFVLLCGASATMSFAGEEAVMKIPKVIFVLEDQATSNQSILKGFREYSRKEAGQLVRIDVAIYDGQTRAELGKELTRGYDLIIPVGDKTLKAVLATQPKLPIFAVQVNQSEFRAIYRQALKQSHTISGIYQDQPFERYAVLVHNLLPQYQRIGILFSQKSKFLKPLFNKIMLQHNLEPVANILLNNDLPQRVLERLAMKCDLVIAINDDNIYSSDNIKSHLLTAFRHKIPMIGTTSKFAEAGAMASIYTDHFKLGKQIAQYVLPMFTNGDKLPPPMYPESFEIAINYNVLRSFGADPIDVQQLRQLLQKVPVMSQ
jgi:ABC-type uncharacterized transport system substrate-binding protein